MTGKRVTRIALFVAVAGLVTGTGHTGPGSLAQLPIQFHLKDRLSVSPAEMASFFALTSLPWTLKPLASVVTDVVRVGSSRRRSYLILAVVTAAIAWCALAAIPASVPATLGAAMGIEIAVMTASVILGALLVESGQRDGATGRLTSIRLTSIYAAGIAAGPIGGWLATRSLSFTAALGVALQAALLVVSLRCVEEPAADEPPQRLGEALRRLVRALTSRPILLPALFGFLVMAEPGFGTLLLYRQTEELGHSPQFIGMTRMAGTLAATATAIVYGFACRHVALRRLVVGGIVTQALAALLFLALRGPGWDALAIFGVYGACSALITLPLWDLAARAAPAGYEGVGYAAMMSALNVAQSFADVFGSWLHDRFGMQFGSLVWLNTGSSLAVLFLIRLVPSGLLDRADRRSA